MQLRWRVDGKNEWRMWFKALSIYARPKWKHGVIYLHGEILMKIRQKSETVKILSSWLIKLQQSQWVEMYSQLCTIYKLSSNSHAWVQIVEVMFRLWKSQFRLRENTDYSNNDFGMLQVESLTKKNSVPSFGLEPLIGALQFPALCLQCTSHSDYYAVKRLASNPPFVLLRWWLNDTTFRKNEGTCPPLKVWLHPKNLKSL